MYLENDGTDSFLNKYEFDKKSTTNNTTIEVIDASIHQMNSYGKSSIYFDYVETSIAEPIVKSKYFIRLDPSGYPNNMLKIYSYGLDDKATLLLETNA